MSRIWTHEVVSIENSNKVKTNSEPSRRSPRIKRVPKKDKITKPKKKAETLKKKPKTKPKKKKESKVQESSESDFEPLPIIDRVEKVKVSNERLVSF